MVDWLISTQFSRLSPRYFVLIKEIDWPTALDCVRRYHYSKTCTTVMARFGVYERDVLVGAVLYSQGAAPNIGKPFGVAQNEVKELVRVALGHHETPTSRIVAVTLRLLKRKYPATRLVVSFADMAQNHVGTIYQAGNWQYLGAKSYHWVRLHGQVVHPKTLFTRYGTHAIPWLRANVDQQAEYVRMPVKHKYVYLFDKSITVQSQPYPCV